jgi:hypothetical protein
MVKAKSKLAAKMFGTEAHMQGGKKMPMKENSEYGTGTKYKAPPKMKKGKNK